MSKEKIKAFPGEKDIRFGQPNDCNEGMDLRDYFAAKALQGMFAGGDTEHLDKSEISEWAFKYADAMMEARKK